MSRFHGFRQYVKKRTYAIGAEDYAAGIVVGFDPEIQACACEYRFQADGIPQALCYVDQDRLLTFEKRCVLLHGWYDGNERP